MRKKAKIGLCIIMLLITIATASASELLTSYTDSDNYNYVGAHAGNEYFMGQSMTPSGSYETYSITNFTISIDGITGDITGINFNVTLWNLSTPSTMLASTVISGSSLPSSGWYNISIDDQLHAVTNNSEVFYYIEHDGGAAGENFWGWDMKLSGAYSGGQCYYELNGGGWTAGCTSTGRDFAFYLYGDEYDASPPPPAEEDTVNITSTTPSNATVEERAYYFNASIDLTNPTLTNCTLWINGTAVYNKTGFTEEQNNISTLQSPTLGDTQWIWGCWDNQTAENSSTFLTYTVQEFNITQGHTTDVYRVGQNITMSCNHTNPNMYGNTTIYYINNTNDNTLFNQTNTTYEIQTSDLLNNLTFFCMVNGSIYNTTSNTDNISGQPDLLFNATVYNSVGTILTNTLVEFITHATNFTANPFTFLASTYLNESLLERNITINATDLLAANQPLHTNITLNETNLQINITLNPNQLTLSFTQLGASHLTTGVIADINRSWNFTNTSFAVIQSQLLNGPVHINFDLTNGENATQFYEYNNNYSIITETLEVLENADWYAYLQVRDMTNAPLDDAIVRASASVPTSYNGTSVYHGLVGQRLTTEDGYTFFWHDRTSQVVYEISKEGYETQTILLTIGDESYTRDDPLIIRLRPIETYVAENARLFIQTRFTNRSKNILGVLTTDSYDTVELQTAYSQSQGFSRYDLSNSQDSDGNYLFTLYSGTDFETTGNENITLNIYLNDELANSIKIEYDDHEVENYFNMSITDSYIWNPLLFIGLLLISGLVGLMIKSATASATTFRIGAILLTFIQPLFIWLGAIFTLEYLLKLVRRFMAE